jgi:hypothetical protein
MKISNLLACMTAVLIAGCSTSVVHTNRTNSIPTPKISSTDSLATIEVAEKIMGSGCSNESFVFFKSGDNKFLEVHGDGGSSATGRAKAAATYDALTRDKGLSTDMIVHPVWEISRDQTFFGLISDNVCAKVVGYRGIIKAIKTTDTITKGEAAREGFFSFFK